MQTKGVLDSVKDQMTVEQAIGELREMFAGKWIAFDFAEDHTVGPRGRHHKQSRYMVQVESPNGDLVYQPETKTLDKLMAQVRKWQAKHSSSTPVER